jgi:hypothetical protein
MTINTKFNIGDEVWFVEYNRPLTARIFRISASVSEGYENQTRIYYYTRQNSCGNYIDRTLYETDLFPDKQSLLNSL